MEAIFSKSLKAGDRTYFIDVKEAKNSSKYLSIAESRPSKNGEKKYTRSSIMVFDNVLDEFHNALDEAFKVMHQ